MGLLMPKMTRSPFISPYNGKKSMQTWKDTKPISAASWQNQQNDYASSEDSDQPGHQGLCCRHEESLGHYIQWVHSEDSDQIGRMPRLIWVFTWHTCHFAGFAMRWLMLIPNQAYTVIWLCQVLTDPWAGCLYISTGTLYALITLILLQISTGLQVHVQLYIL